MIKLIIAFLAFTVLTSFKADETDSVKDYLGIGESLSFNEKIFTLAWSSNPTSGYYKQEYLLDSATVENYNEMILVEAIKGDISPKLAAQSKIAELKELKKNNPVINWNLYERKNEVILDFVITDNATKYEWNLYRYSTVKDSTKQKYLVLQAYSYKDILFTNEDLKPFFNRILENRDAFMRKLGKLDLSEIKISK
ncbi:MAG: hypothetical protein COA38_02795 [Fluviicola sp.]|nr:MAG: hypothetical protein COA38_02795 [Fluviicola sp.]